MLIIERLKSWALTALAVLLVLMGAYIMGGRASRKAADKRRQYDDALRVAAGAKEAHDAQVKVGAMRRGDPVDELRRDWMRDAGDNDQG